MNSKATKFSGCSTDAELPWLESDPLSILHGSTLVNFSYLYSHYMHTKLQHVAENNILQKCIWSKTPQYHFHWLFVRQMYKMANYTVELDRYCLCWYQYSPIFLSPKYRWYRYRYSLLQCSLAYSHSKTLKKCLSFSLFTPETRWRRRYNRRPCCVTHSLLLIGNSAT